jgi:hypothetical protein
MTKKKPLKFLNKLFFKKWVIGICQGNIKDVIRRKEFDGDISWLFTESFDKFFADPFPLTQKSGDELKILYEEFEFQENYGKISLMTLDRNLKQIHNKKLLDTKSHLSYPFSFVENDKTYVFPEAAQSGKLSCYKFCTENETLVFQKDVLNIPLRDSTILKYNGKYWIFGALNDNYVNYHLGLYYSDSLLGPFTPHPTNGAYKGLDGIRSAGNFIEVDDVLYRPTQNCKKNYGESITINKVIALDETRYVEEPYFTIKINKKRSANRGMNSIHTINSVDNFIVVDGEHWAFSPFWQLKKFLFNNSKEKNRKFLHK